MEESKLILSSLSQNILCSDIMNSLVSYKDNYKKIKQPKKPKKGTTLTF